MNKTVFDKLKSDQLSKSAVALYVLNLLSILPRHRYEGKQLGLALDAGCSREHMNQVIGTLSHKGYIRKIKHNGKAVGIELKEGKNG